MDNSKLKKIASHTVAIVVGLLLATQCQGPKTQIVTKEVIKEVKVEVPVEVIKEVVKYKRKTKIVHHYAPPIIVEKNVCEYSYYYDLGVLAARHRVSLKAGRGPKSLKTTAITNGYQVELDRGFIFGASYDYRFSGPFSVGVEALSNQSYLGSLGVEF
jgi:hypothetical protein